MPSSTLDPDPWLGRLLERPAFRLGFPAGTGGTTHPRPAPAGGPVFIYAKVDVAAHDRCAFLESLGFRLVDTNVTFEMASGQEPASRTAPDREDAARGLRLARPEDEASAVSLAQRSFRKSRFHNDAEIRTDLADRIKGEWTRNFFSGARGDAMVVSEADGALAGFMLLLAAPDALVIDLVAVDEAHRGRGLAGAMTRFAAANLPAKPLLRVGTQIANAPAIRAYQGMGFALAASQYIFHYHGPMPAALTESDA